MIDNDIIHSRPRLLLMIMLCSVEECTFTFLKNKLLFTDGVLSVHLQKLEEHTYISVTKSFTGKRPQTTYTITKGGKRKLLEYINEMEELFDIVKKSL
jgi:DNA-binding PadR family transcriptional regulator